MKKYQGDLSRRYGDLREMIKDAAARFPEHKAFILKTKKGKEASYRDIGYVEFVKDIDAFGTALLALKAPAQRVAIIGKNCYPWAVAYLAVMNGAGVAVPLDKGLQPAEIEGLIIKSGADAIIFDGDYAGAMETLREKGTTGLRHYICMDHIPAAASGSGAPTDGGAGFLHFETLLREGYALLAAGDRAYLDAVIDKDALAAILFTSGTSALAKGVMLSHRNLCANLHSLSRSEPFFSTDVNLAFLPFHHTFASTGLLLFLSHGMTNVFCDGLKYIADNLREYQVSIFVCVPLILEAMNKRIWKEIGKQGKTGAVKALLGLSDFLMKLGIDLRRTFFKSIIDSLGGSLRLVISGAAAIDKDVARNFNQFGILTVQGYGLTECSPVLSAERPGWIRPGSVGIHMPDVEVKIDRPNEAGIGEIVARGENIMLGYYGEEALTAETIVDGWFHTGDLGRMDKDGVLFITGREKNVIVLKNGKNIYPEEVEALFTGLPYVKEVMVFGMPKDEDLVISVKIVCDTALFEGEAGGEPTEAGAGPDWPAIRQKVEADIDAINEGLPLYKRIRRLILTDQPMIKTTTQKVKRNEEIKRILEEK